MSIYIGKKPTLNYVLAVVTELNSGSKTVTIMARGRSINKAVDVAEIVRNRFVQDAKVKRIKIGTDHVDTDEGQSVNVSSIEIVLEA